MIGFFFNISIKKSSISLMLMLSLVKEIMTLKLSFIKRHVQHGRTTVMAVSLCNFDDDWDVTQILALNDLLF